MNDIQSYKAAIRCDDYFTAINVTFPFEVAEEVLCQMENIFGSKFQKMYGHIPANELIQSFCLVLNGVTAYQLSKGVERMRMEQFCPTLADFGLWCRQNCEFWSEQLAWVKAVNFLNHKDAEITVLAKRALDEVLPILHNEGQVAAGFAFRALYKEYVDCAVKNGERQEMWNKAMRVNNMYKTDSTSLLDIHNTDYHRNIARIQQELMKKGLSPKQARIEAQKEVSNTEIAPMNKYKNIKAVCLNKRQTLFRDLIKNGKSISEAFLIAKDKIISEA